MVPSRFRAGRLELVLCIVGPILVLAAIMIPGMVRCRILQKQLFARQAALDQIPSMESQLAAARAVLRRVTAAKESDGAADLTLAVDSAASMYGVSTRSVNVEKQTTTDGWIDYRVAISATGPLPAFVGMLDFLEHPARRFKVLRVVMKPKGYDREAPYDAELVLFYRALLPSAPDATGRSHGAISSDVTDRQLVRLRQATEVIESWLNEKRPLVVAVKSEQPGKPGRAEPVRPLRQFVLNGLIRDGKNPLALTDRGIVGVGDRLDGLEIIAIADDCVTVRDMNGSTETVKLYADDPP